MSDVPFLQVEVYKPGWSLQIRRGMVALACVCATLLLVFLWWGFSLSAMFFMLYQGAVPVGLVLGLVVLLVYGASAFDDRRVKKRLRRSMECGGGELAGETSGEMIAREIREMSFSQWRDLPGRFVSETNAELPEAIVLHCGDRFGPGTMVRPVKEPLSCSTPFEPLPLGRDPERTRTLLDSFVWKYPNAGSANRGGSDARSYFSGSRSASVFSLPGTLGAVGGMMLLVLLTGDLTKLYLVACVAGPSFVYHIGRLILSSYRENSTPLVWLFPGAIGIRGGRGDSADQRGDIVVRRGSGTLWYDAAEGKLFVPLPNGGHRVIMCPLEDGLVAMWTWLNTASAPDRISLDEIA